MTFEDFITPTDLKDGFTATSRVEELVSFMQSNKDSVVKNTGDACKQWAAVASTIAATKNRECLDVFIRLDGLCFISRWLKDVQASDSTDSSIEESILALLRALKNLCLDGSKLIYSGIWHSVKNLAACNNSRIQDLAGIIFDSWTQIKVHDLSDCGNDRIPRLHQDETKVTAASGESSGHMPNEPLQSRESKNEDICLGVAGEAGNSEHKPDEDNGLGPQNDKLGSDTKVETSNASFTNDIMNAGQESFSMKEKKFKKDTTSEAIGTSHLEHLDNVDRPSDILPADEISKGTKQIEEHEQCTENYSAPVAVAASSVEVGAMCCDSAVANTDEAKEESILPKMIDSKVAQNCSRQMPPLKHMDDKYKSDDLSGLSNEHDTEQKDEHSGVSLHADVGLNNNDKGNANAEEREREKHASMTVSQHLEAIDKSAADIEVETAHAVAREVDLNEQSRDDSAELSGERGQSGLSDSMEEEQQTLGTGTSLNKAAMDEDHSGEQGLDSVMDLNKKTPENDMSVDEIEPCQVSADKSQCDFNLNDEPYLAVSSISTSTVATSGVPPATMCPLEETVSWNGSAAASAFPELPHKVSLGDLREKKVFGIDLNVAKDGDDHAEAESSLEAKPVESGRFNLDLNCTNEDDNAPLPSESRMETRLFLNCNAHQSASPASSLSAQQSDKKVEIDLNDRPQFPVDSSDKGPCDGRHPWSTNSYKGHNMNEQVISILGTKVEVNRKDSHSTVPMLLSNGRSLDPSLNLNMARAGNTLGLAHGVSSTPTPIYGYNGLSEPPGLSLSSPMYVPGNSISYMMDSSRAQQMMPRVMGSSPNVHPAYTQQHHFMSRPGPSSSLNGLGPMRPNFDRNMGFDVVETENRDPVSIRQLLSPGQSSPVEHVVGGTGERSLVSPMAGGKRKEPEAGWEHYTQP